MELMDEDHSFPFMEGHDTILKGRYLAYNSFILFCF